MDNSFRGAGLPGRDPRHRPGSGKKYMPGGVIWIETDVSVHCSAYIGGYTMTTITSILWQSKEKKDADFVITRKKDKIFIIEEKNIACYKI
jgi:hypothetical protein